MIKNYHIIQVLDDSYCDTSVNYLTIGIVTNLNDNDCFDEEDDEGDNIYRDSIRFKTRNNPWGGYDGVSIRKDMEDDYSLLTCKVEYYKNGKIKKPILKGGRKVRLLSPTKARKKVKKRTRRMVRGS